MSETPEDAPPVLSPDDMPPSLVQDSGNPEHPTTLDRGEPEDIAAAWAETVAEDPGGHT